MTFIGSGAGEQGPCLIVAHGDSSLADAIEEIFQVEGALASLVPLCEDLGQVGATGVLATKCSADILDCSDVSRAKVQEHTACG